MLAFAPAAMADDWLASPPASTQRLPALNAWESDPVVVDSATESQQALGRELVAPGPGSSDVDSNSLLDDDELDLLLMGADGEHRWRLLPNGLIYRNYLAGAKESRIRGVYSNEQGRGYVWDVTLGGRVGLLRYGNAGYQRPEGFQVDLEGAGLLRLDPEEEMDVDAADFRIGVPITWGNRYYQTKLAYYHLSSHLQDEWLIKHPGYPRLNYSRDVIVWGQSLYVRPEVRLYFEAGWAFASDVSEPWELQFGIERSPYHATGFRGAPFWAFNAHLRQEVDFGGNFVAQAGWAWRGNPSSGLLRIGLDYYNGKSDQFSFYDYHEEKLGLGIWYDF